MNKKTIKKIGGVPANIIVVPLVIVITILHAIVVLLALETYRSNEKLSQMMQNSNMYQQQVTNLQANSSALSEIAVSFSQIPVKGNGDFNTEPLVQYAIELGKDRSGAQIAEWFKTQDIKAETQGYIDSAASASKQMYDTQIHTFAIICSVYPQPQIPELATVSEAILGVSLTEEELAMTEENRINYARGLLATPNYTTLKATVSENAENARRLIDEEYSNSYSESADYINYLRVLLWITVSVVIIIMVLTFILLYCWLILPMRKSTKQIASDRVINNNSPIREMRLLNKSYNALLTRRDKLEGILRSTAETDALTGLPNRYCLQRDVLEGCENCGAMAVLMFDVNYLKRMNDANGHAVGDKLLRAVAIYIRKCFGMDDGGRCYRIGGDEFAVVLRKCSEEEVRSRIERFLLMTERANISVSVGYAFSKKVDENTFDILMEKADKQMYAHKKGMHDIERKAIQN